MAVMTDKHEALAVFTRYGDSELGRMSKDHVEAWIADTGCEIPKESIAEAFQDASHTGLDFDGFYKGLFKPFIHETVRSPGAPPPSPSMLRGRPKRVVATAPVRACDVGGWTDTWFADHGAVFHVAVAPGVRAEVTLLEGTEGPPVELVVPDMPQGPHPLLHAACDEADVPAGLRVRVCLSSNVPPGASLGTSAAVVVALIGALDAFVGRQRTPAELAQAAHHVETKRLGLQSGVQDQLAAAIGGAELVEIDKYPSSRTTPLPLPEGRLVVVYLGRSHVSSHVHEQVIASLDGTDRLEALRVAARAAADAVRAGDMVALGKAMRAANEGQRALHPALIDKVAEAVGALADKHGALGWKVNGAGGDGGSVSILMDREQDPSALIAELPSVGPGVRVLDLSPSAQGITVQVEH